MATIKLKGDKELIDIPKQTAITIKKNWTGDGVPKRSPTDTFELPSGRTCLYGQILEVDPNAVVHDHTETQKKNVEEIREMYNQDWKYKLEFSHRTPQQKSESMIDFVTFFHSGISDLEKIPDLEMPEVKQILLDFYTANPFRQYPDLKLFKRLWSMHNKSNQLVMPICLEVIRLDYDYEKKLKKHANIPRKS